MKYRSYPTSSCCHLQGVTVSNVALPAAPLSEVRDVVETFRRLHVVQQDWADVLSKAATALDSMPDHQANLIHFDKILNELRTLLNEGFYGNENLVARIADETADMLRRAIPAGIPTPDDEDWAFPAPTDA